MRFHLSARGEDHFLGGVTVEHRHDLGDCIEAHGLPVGRGGELHEPVEVGPPRTVAPVHPSHQPRPEFVLWHPGEHLGELGGHLPGDGLPVGLISAAGHYNNDFL